MERVTTLPGAKPLILLVGLGDSVHTARWVNMLAGRGFRFVVFPVYQSHFSSDIENSFPITKLEDFDLYPNGVGLFDIDSISNEELQEAGDEGSQEVDQQRWRPQWLADMALTGPAHLLVAIRRLRPALVHSLVVQLGGYLTLAAKQLSSRTFPTWLLSNWGSDLYLFRKLHDHQPLLRQIAMSIDAYHAECERDAEFIRDFGFQGPILPAVPASGGMDFAKLPALQELPLTSQRSSILLKGYHGWSGRAVHILSAIHLAADALRRFTIRLTLAGAEVNAMARAVAAENELNIVVEPFLPSHEGALRRLGECRFVVGLGISDGISTTLLEAMAVGTFPIQATSSCGNEWVVPGKTGCLVSPHDTRELAEALRLAATNDSIVDTAAVANRAVVERRWNAEYNGQSIAKCYASLCSGLQE